MAHNACNRKIRRTDADHGNPRMMGGRARVLGSARFVPARLWSRAHFRVRSIVSLGVLFLFLISLTALSVARASAQSDASPPPPVMLTAQQDHQRLMELLHITSLREGVSGNPQAPNAANYDESKANPYPNLPDPLLLENGRKVTNAKMWWSERRPEIVEDFDREVYGRVPRKIPQVRWEVTSTLRETNGDVPVITKHLLGHVDNSSYPLVSVDIQLNLSTPADATGPVPVMMEFTFVPRPGAGPPRPPQAGAPGTGGPAGPNWQQQLLARGWGYATIIPTSYQADHGAGLTQGIIGLVNKGQPRKVDDWGALRAWAWGASRALDYFETDKAVDAKHVGIEGLSRYGKAAIVTMAYDQRFAIGFIGSSGEGGVKLNRRNCGEIVENVASSGEYHWMAGNFLKYAGPLTWNDLPVDSHELVALCAPRPVFISCGAFQGDSWVDAKGMFLAAVGAGPAYELLGKHGLGTSEFPPIETALIDGEVAFRQHSGGHTTGPNWPTFLIFASRYIKAPPPAKPSQKAGY
ncbi:MAG TPA: acetylxylan esterase [Blastocatellia bacterium]